MNKNNMTINDFKQLIINDLLAFVLTQNPKEQKTEEEWINLYCEWLDKEKEID